MQIVEREFWPDGSLRNETFIINGKKEGSSKHWFSDGKLCEEVTYRDNKRNGIHNRFYRNGKMECTELFIDGFCYGVNCGWHLNGFRHYISTWRKDRRDGIKISFFYSELDEKHNRD